MNARQLRASTGGLIASDPAAPTVPRLDAVVFVGEFRGGHGSMVVVVPRERVGILLTLWGRPPAETVRAVLALVVPMAPIPVVLVPAGGRIEVSRVRPLGMARERVIARIQFRNRQPYGWLTKGAT